MGMAPMSAIAKELHVGATALRRIVDRAYRAGNLALAYTKTDAGTVYDVDAVKVAAFPYLPELRERHAKAKADDPPAPSRKHFTPLRPRGRAREPEVIIMRRRPLQEEKR